VVCQWALYAGSGTKIVTDASVYLLD